MATVNINFDENKTGLVGDAGNGSSYNISGGADAELFKITSDGQITFNDAAFAPNFEAKSDYTFDVIHSNWECDTINVHINDLNEPATTVTLSSSIVNENVGGVLIGILGNDDPDAAGPDNSYIYHVDPATPFEIKNVNELWVKSGSGFDFETTPTVKVLINADASNLDPDILKEFVISVKDVNDVAPSGLNVGTPAAIPENTAIVAGTKISSFSYEDDTGAAHQLTGTDAASFEITNVNKAGTTVTGDVVWRAVAPPDFESKSSYDINVVVSDAGTSLTQAIAVQVTDVNEGPTNFSFSAPAKVTENVAIPPGKVVTTVSGIVDDALGTNTVSLSGAHAGLFEVAANGKDIVWKAAATPDYETNASYTFNILVGDAGAAGSVPVAKPVLIDVVDVFEPGNSGGGNPGANPVTNGPGTNNPGLSDAAVASTTAALIVSNFVNGKIPVDADKLASLSAFAELQLNAYAAAKVGDPNMGPYEALGRGFSTTDEFKGKYDALSEDAYIKTAYKEVLGRDATAEQVSHFQAQVDYFQKIYADAKISDVDGTLYAKGAVFGQMIAAGVLYEPTQHKYVAEAAAFLADAADGKVEYNLPLNHWDVV